MNSNTQKHISQGRPPASKGEDKREHILDNALTLFAGQGIAGTTVAQIAKASGVTSAMVHYYFTNREGLLDAIVAERLGPAIQYVWTGISEEALQEPRAMVTEFVDRLLATVERMPQLPLLWSREILNVGGQLRNRIMSVIPVGKFEKARRIFSDAQQNGKVAAGISPELIIASIMGLIMVPLAARDILGKIPAIPAVDKQTLRKHVLVLLLDGLSPEKNPEVQQ